MLPQLKSTKYFLLIWNIFQISNDDVLADAHHQEISNIEQTVYG